MFKGLKRSSFLVAGGLFFQKEASRWALITEREALPCHRFDTQVFLQSSPGRAVATDAKLPSVFVLTLCTLARARVCFSSLKQARMRRCV